MAKCETRLTGDFYTFVTEMDREILNGSISATLEDSSDVSVQDVRCAVRVYERYSYMGGNRVSLSVTVLGKGDDLFVSAIASGGSQALFFKVNTFGESAFLDKFIDFVERFKHRSR
ncbi:MAG: hypothetical protein E7326_06075 [Clostridiales bacterium]|nr:hypothetical protein [Clostridiales bacterium]